MVNDLLDVSRLDRGVVAFHPIRLDLAALVSETMDEFRLLVGARELELHLPDRPVPAEADPDRIRQVLLNFLDNALKYTPSHGPVAVALTTTNGSARVEVTDRGPGIPEDEWDLLFTRFFRVQSPIHQEGLGLGLYIARDHRAPWRDDRCRRRERGRKHLLLRVAAGS